MSLWNAVCSVHLCFSVRKRTIARLAGEFFLSQSAQSSLSIFAHSFEPTEGLRHTEFTEAFQQRLAVTLCDIGWLNVSVHLCEICSSVFFCEKKNAPSMWERMLESCWVVFSLTELTDLTEPFCAQFRAHRRPPAYRYHRGLTPSPSPNGEGSSMWGYPFWPADERRWAAKHLEDM